MQAEDQKSDILENPEHQIRFDRSGSTETPAGDVNPSESRDGKDDGKEYQKQVCRLSGGYCPDSQDQEYADGEFYPGDYHGDVIYQAGRDDAIVMDNGCERQGIDDLVDAGVNEKSSHDEPGGEKEVFISQEIHHLYCPDSSSVC